MTGKKQINEGEIPEYIFFLSGILNKVGLVGFIVFCVSVYLMAFTTIEQKREIIDLWVLFKGDSLVIPIAVNISAILFVIYLAKHYRTKVKHLKERLEDAVEEKKLLHQLLLNKELNTSRR